MINWIIKAQTSRCQKQESDVSPSIVLHPEQPEGIAEFLSKIRDVRLLKPQDENEVLECLGSGAEILVTFRWRDEYLLSSLEWIASTSAGYEQYPIRQLQSQGVKVTTASGASAIAAAEHAFALMLSLTRRIPEACRNMRSSRWAPVVGHELFNRNLAIVGLGQIGEQIAVRANVFGMHVIGIKKRPNLYSGSVQDVRGTDCLPAVCEWADFLVLCAPGSNDVSPLISARELRLLRDGWLINIGRGSLVDTEALIEALRFGQLQGAGLDVVLPEPLPENSPLWSLEKVIITSHSAGRSEKYGHRWGEIFLRNMIAFRENRDWVNLVVTDTP